MATPSLGSELRELCAEAQHSVLLVAPFIKAPVLQHLLDVVPGNVEIRCVTRWVPLEIVSGVSDLDVWPVLRARGGWLGLEALLHAKYYRADKRCRVGSANLTHAALGWKANSNLELWVDADPGRSDLQAFEASLLRGAVEVTDELHAEYERVVDRLREILPPPPTQDETEVEELRNGSRPAEPGAWIPHLRHPEDLYRAYAGEMHSLTTTAREDARLDLAQLGLPPGLPRDAFDLHVRIALLQKSVVRALDIFVAEPQRFGAVRRWIQTQPCAVGAEFDATEAWQVLMRWLLHFAGDRYVSWTANYSELFWRRIP